MESNWAICSANKKGSKYCVAGDENGITWTGTCTKNKNGTWSCKETPGEISHQLRKAILASQEGKITGRKKKARA
jgi:hypothetical protein